MKLLKGVKTKIKKNYYKDSEDKSIIDTNHKTKGYLDLQSLNRTEITKEIAKKYNIQCTSPNLIKFEGYLYTDDHDSYVALVAVGTYKNLKSWIMPIQISEEYRGYNLSKQLMKVAITELGAKHLGVYADNEVAIKLYKDYGFKIYKKLRSDKYLVYYMTIDPKEKIKRKYLKES